MVSAVRVLRFTCSAGRPHRCSGIQTPQRLMSKLMIFMYVLHVTVYFTLWEELIAIEVLDSRYNKTHIETDRALCYGPTINPAINTSSVIWAEYVACKGTPPPVTTYYIILDGKCPRKWRLGRCTNKLENNIKVDLKAKRCDDKTLFGYGLL